MPQTVALVLGLWCSYLDMTVTVNCSWIFSSAQSQPSFSRTNSSNDVHRSQFFFSTSASWSVLVTGNSQAHKWIIISHFCRVSFDLEKKLPCLIDFLVLHCLHHQLNWSVTSHRGFSDIGIHLLWMVIYNLLLLHCLIFIVIIALSVNSWLVIPWAITSRCQEASVSV